MIFKGTTEAFERICLFNSKWIVDKRSIQNKSSRLFKFLSTEYNSMSCSIGTLIGSECGTASSKLNITQKIISISHILQSRTLVETGLPPRKNLAKTWANRAVVAQYIQWNFTRIGVEKEFPNGSWRFYDTGRRIGSTSSTWQKPWSGLDVLSVEEQIAVTLYFLKDQGSLFMTANTPIP